jgi:LysM repeat protein
MVFVLMVSAVILAVATFLTILLITSRSSLPGTGSTSQTVGVQPRTIVVNGVPIVVHIDPNKEIRLQGEVVPIPSSGVGQGVVPTATPPPVVQGPTFTPPPIPTATRDPNPVIFVPYTVVQGDNLYSIAEAKNSSIELMALHEIDDGNMVPGTVIERLPIANPVERLPIANPAYCPGTRAYVVRDKDTVFRIAAQFNTTVQAIAAANGLDQNYTVSVTQVICIPV